MQCALFRNVVAFFITELFHVLQTCEVPSRCLIQIYDWLRDLNSYLWWFVARLVYKCSYLTYCCSPLSVMQYCRKIILKIKILKMIGSEKNCRRQAIWAKVCFKSLTNEYIIWISYQIDFWLSPFFRQKQWFQRIQCKAIKLCEKPWQKPRQMGQKNW